MKDEHRKFSTCIFCGVEMSGRNEESKRSREHIFGQAIAKLHPVTSNWMASNKQFDPAPKKGSSPITHLTSRSVCRNCNNTWLSEVAEQAISPMENLILGKKCVLTAKEQRALHRYFWRFAAIVDAETSNLELNLDPTELRKYAEEFGFLRYFPPTIRGEQRLAFKNDGHMSDFTMTLWHHKDLLGADPTFNVVDLGSHRDARAKRILLAIGRVVFSLEIGQHKPLRALEESDFAEGFIEQINWPTPNAISYDSFYSLYHQDQQTRYIRACFKRRSTRKYLESEFRRTNKWKWDSIPPHLRP